MNVVVLVTSHFDFNYAFIADHCKSPLDTRNAVKESKENVQQL